MPPFLQACCSGSLWNINLEFHQLIIFSIRSDLGSVSETRTHNSKGEGGLKQLSNVHGGAWHDLKHARGYCRWRMLGEREREKLPAHNAQSESGYSTEQSTPVLRHPEDLYKSLIGLGRCILKLMLNILRRMHTTSWHLYITGGYSSRLHPPWYQDMCNTTTRWKLICDWRLNAFKLRFSRMSARWAQAGGEWVDRILQPHSRWSWY